MRANKPTRAHHGATLTRLAQNGATCAHHGATRARSGNVAAGSGMAGSDIGIGTFGVTTGWPRAASRLTWRLAELRFERLASRHCLSALKPHSRAQMATRLKVLGAQRAVVARAAQCDRVVAPIGRGDVGGGEANVVVVVHLGQLVRESLVERQPLVERVVERALDAHTLQVGDCERWRTRTCRQSHSGSSRHRSRRRRRGIRGRGCQGCS